MPECLRCGKCCIIFNWAKELWEDCRFLVRCSDGKTKCKIYDKRLGAYCGFFQFCGLRSNLPFDIPGCPFNKGDPVHPAYKNEDPGYCHSRSW